MKQQKALTDVFKTTTETTRLAILILLMDKPRVVGELLEAIGINYARISSHLNRLSVEKFISFEREGNFKRFSIVNNKYEKIQALIKAGEDLVQ